jgi:predicted membrane chloride channel (bestrophin family)
VLHLKFFLTIWLIALPFSLFKLCHWGTIPIASVVGYALLGFEEIGNEIENPFGSDYNDLPLDIITATIAGNLFDSIRLIESTAATKAAVRVSPAVNNLVRESMASNNGGSHANSALSSYTEVHPISIVP